MPDTAGLGDLWIQVSRLTERCHVLITTVAYPPGWRVTIRPQDTDGPSVTADGEHVLETLAVAVGRANAKGLG